MDRGAWQAIVHGVKVKYILSHSTFNSRHLILKNIKYMLKKIYIRIFIVELRDIRESASDAGEAGDSGSVSGSGRSPAG